ncbi:hypothetical protein ISCGN_032208 [Ixodes scapularis]
MEHVTLNRLMAFVEDNHLLPPQMVGFRAGLSVQDVMLQLKHQILQPTTSRNTRAILGLDLTKAFDNVSHEAILTNLAAINPGPRMYGYIKAFLTDRQATITLGSLTSDPIQLGSYGTPQGSVLSPFLFNLALLLRLNLTPFRDFIIVSTQTTLRCGWEVAAMDTLRPRYSPLWTS